jgi:hypothetical protein
MTGILLADDRPGHRARLDRVRSACAALPGSAGVFRSYVFPGGADHAV